MSEGSRGAYGGGFVERAVRAADGAEAALDDDADAADVAAVLSATLFGEVLGYGTDGYERDGHVARFRDDDGDVGVTFAAAASADEVGAAVVAAFEAASAEPSVRYVVAGGLDRLLVFERVDDDAPADDDGIVDADAVDDRRTVAGVTATTHTEIPLGDVIEAGRRGKLSQTLRPGPQIAVAKLAALRPGELAPADRYEEFDTPGERSIDDGDDDELETLVGTLRDCLGDVLAPAVADAQARLREDVERFDDRAATLREAATAAARGDGDDTAAGPTRRRLLAHEDAYADARALRAAYGTWVRGAGRTGFTPTENRRAFARVVAFQLVEEAFLVRVIEGMEFLDDTLTGEAVERFEAFADDAGVDRDAGDLFGIARERLGSVYDRRAPDLAGWALADDGVAEALSRTVWYLDHFSFDGDPERAVAVYDRLLSVADLPRIDTDPADPDPLVPALLDAAGYTSDGWSDGGGDGDAGATDLLDPAVGDGRYLLAAGDRLRAGLADRDYAERLAAVRERLTGASPDPLACRVTETRLLLRLLDDYREARWEHGDYTLDTLPVYCTDPLIRDDDAEPTPAPLARDDYGYVVGAPPATLRRDVADGPVDEAYAEYDTAYYTYDTSALYVERAGDWLAENGTLALRVAGRFRDTRFGQKLRERLPQWYRLEELREVDGVAAGGTPVLLVARRFRKNEPFTDPDEYAPPTYGFAYAEGLGAPSVRRSSARLTGDEWVWDADGDDDEIGI
ncbi:hypothetical protein [Halobaculum lipolyticum]|uniref:site-specific DNA-methyltransferase (adenine-specific) n=1 Tax=Halobaculum lipolyticum TaxID=3032001 RepID=A0ABD5WAN6_9EURY|nr:hypothetical protein [Halobaculum sp. DT31]